MPVQLPPLTLPWIEQKKRYVPRWRNRLDTDSPWEMRSENVHPPP